jgi:hypothetical protein
MNWVVLFASGTNITGCAFAMIPVKWPSRQIRQEMRKPWI